MRGRYAGDGQDVLRSRTHGTGGAHLPGPVPRASTGGRRCSRTQPGPASRPRTARRPRPRSPKHRSPAPHRSRARSLNGGVFPALSVSTLELSPHRAACRARGSAELHRENDVRGGDRTPVSWHRSSVSARPMGPYLSAASTSSRMSYGTPTAQSEVAVSVDLQPAPSCKPLP